mmetsp:Transcript_44960/g.85949  ORF Transcript_44960/g.85949 Transcript_44960/m.85949 type:complete len:309 (+) Transcript_44960:1644-2570(+)
MSPASFLVEACPACISSCSTSFSNRKPSPSPSKCAQICSSIRTLDLGLSVGISLAGWRLSPPSLSLSPSSSPSSMISSGMSSCSESESESSAALARRAMSTALDPAEGLGLVGAGGRGATSRSAGAGRIAISPGSPSSLLPPLLRLPEVNDRPRPNIPVPPPSPSALGLRSPNDHFFFLAPETLPSDSASDAEAAGGRGGFLPMSPENMDALRLGCTPASSCWGPESLNAPLTLRCSFLGTSRCESRPALDTESRRAVALASCTILSASSLAADVMRSAARSASSTASFWSLSDPSSVCCFDRLSSLA